MCNRDFPLYFTYLVQRVSDSCQKNRCVVTMTSGSPSNVKKEKKNVLEERIHIEELTWVMRQVR